MDSKEFFASFRQMSEFRQNKIIIESFRQIADTHTLGLSLDHFTWRDCSIEDGKLRFNVGRNNHLTPVTEERNLTDYAAVIYCLATGNNSSEAMGWDAGRKIDSAVLREIVLTLSGRNYSTQPLLAKLMQPYIDEDTFFSGYYTVDEKEAFEAYERQCRIDDGRRQDEARAVYEENSKKAREIAAKSYGSDAWWTKWWYLLLVVVIVGGVKACKTTPSCGISSVQVTRPVSRLSTMMVRNVPSQLPPRPVKLPKVPDIKLTRIKVPEVPKVVKLPEIPDVPKHLKELKVPKVSKFVTVPTTPHVSKDSSMPATSPASED